jgi:hypothetical protein
MEPEIRPSKKSVVRGKVSYKKGNLWNVKGFLLGGCGSL